ncbi:MAG TPA: hypothetical protein VGF69_16785 [Thermoanaerobaculia bacterium]
MKNQKLSCLTWTIVFLSLAIACGWFVQRRAPGAVPAVGGGFVGALLLVIALGWIVAIVTRTTEWWRIVRARLGQDARDGQRVAIIGVLRGHGELLAPFSHERCVLYSYDVITRDIQDGESSDRTMYEGFAMVPLSIEHDAERTRILARPEVPGLKAIQRTGRTAEANAKNYVESTTFAAASAVKTVDEDLSHTDGHLRVDSSRPPLETTFGACRWSEKLLHAETPICAIGTYRADRRALAGPITFRTGSSFGIEAAWRTVNAVISAAIFIVIALGAVAIFTAGFPIDAYEQRNPQSRLGWWEVRLERLVEQHLRTWMGPRGMLASSGFHLQELCEGCANGRLEIDDRTIELKHAAYMGGRSVHLSATRGGKDGITLVDGDRIVLTIDGKSAPVPATWMQPHDVETSLGSNGSYEGRVTVMAPDGWIRCRVQFHTRVNADEWLPSRR